MILVTGASGIVGAQIIRELLNQNQKVRALKRMGSDISWTSDINDQIEWVESNLLDILALERAFKGVSHVVHCAAIVSFDNSNDSQMHQVNIEGTKNILALSQQHKIQKVVYISSVAALGRAVNTTTITEKAKWEESTLNTEYAKSKYLAELEVWRAQEEGLPTIILNPSAIIGPGNWSSSSLNLFKHVKKGSPLYPIGSINYVDVRDVATVATTFLFNKAEAERFILNAGLLSYKAFFNLIAKALNKKGPSIKINPSLAIFVAYILKMIRILTGIKFSITPETAKLSQLHVLFSANKVESLLNYTFRSIEDSIDWTCKHLERKNYKP